MFAEFVRNTARDYLLQIAGAIFLLIVWVLHDGFMALIEVFKEIKQPVETDDLSDIF